MHALQRQLCETFSSMSIKTFGGGIRLWGFLTSSVFSLNAKQRSRHNRANELLEK